MKDFTKGVLVTVISFVLGTIFLLIYLYYKVGNWLLNCIGFDTNC